MKELKIDLFDLVLALTTAVDLICEEVADHHKRVAYIANCIAREAGLPEDELYEIIVASALHDIGALTLHMNERLALMEFDNKDTEKHVKTGYQLLRNFPPFAHIAKIILHHHCHWERGAGKEEGGKPVPLNSHLIHLADRIDALIRRDRNVLDQREFIVDTIKGNSGKIFHPDFVKGFEKMSHSTCFWLDIVSKDIHNILMKQVNIKRVETDLSSILNYVKLFSQLIDFRSPYTAYHSCGVAAVAEKLAEIFCFSETERKLMRVAGYLHDIGKLAVPLEILEKNAILTLEEINVVKPHAYYTYRILEKIDGFESVNNWASCHHERIDGNGYPFGFREEQLSLGAKILAVADVFTALSEARPYRDGLGVDDVIQILDRLVKDGAIDSKVVDQLIANWKTFSEIRLSAQLLSQEKYEAVFKSAT